MIDSTTIEMLSGLAERLHKAGVFGAEVTSADKAFAVLLKGHELGFTPMASAGSIAIIKGKVSLSADATVALCKRSPACLYLRLVASSEEVATYETQRHGDPSPTSLTYTIAMATRAGLTGSQTWRGHAHAMLRARCGAAIARAVYPDLVAGIYDPDEVAEIVRAEPVRAEVPAPRVEVPDTSLETWRETLADVSSLRDMHAAWALAAPSLHAAGRADHGRTLASERLTALGYALTIAEVQSVLSARCGARGPSTRARAGIGRTTAAREGRGAATRWRSSPRRSRRRRPTAHRRGGRCRSPPAPSRRGDRSGCRSCR